MSVRALLASVLLLGALVPAAASADAPRGELVVEGKGNTTTELVLRSELQLRSPQPTLTGGGSYAAVLVEPVDPGPGRAALGGVRVRAFGDRTGDATAVLGVDGRLPAGRYRVTLLGEGPTRAAFALADDQATGVQVTPRTPAKVQFLGRAEKLDDGRSRARVDLPGALPARTRALQVTLLDGTHVDDLRMCATTAADCGGTPRAVVGALPVTGPQIAATLVPAAAERRSLRWSVDGTRDLPERLRVAALLF